MRPAAHSFALPVEEDDGGDGVHLGAADAAGGRPNVASDDPADVTFLERGCQVAECGP